MGTRAPVDINWILGYDPGRLETSPRVLDLIRLPSYHQKSSQGCWEDYRSCSVVRRALMVLPDLGPIHVLVIDPSLGRRRPCQHYNP